MKKILLSIFTITIGLVSFGQTSFTSANEPSIGESRMLYVCDSMAPNYEAITGNGVTWNYGLTDTYVGETRLLEIVTPASTGYASDFPGSTKTVQIANYISTFMSSSATERISQGYLVESVDLGIVKAKFTNDPENLMTYPFALNGQVSDIFSGNLSFTYNSIPQNPACNGNSQASYDGYGTLVQVNGIAVSNVARFHIIDTTNAVIPIIGSSKVIRNQFEYYDLASSNKTPIFVHSSVRILSGFPEPLVDMSVILSSVPGNGVASIENLESKKFMVYPNPSKDFISITNLPENAKVSIVDISGRTQVLSKINSTEFNVSNFNTGIYILLIETEGKTTMKRLIIE